MSFKSKRIAFIRTDSTLYYQFLLAALFVAGPILHYLCFYNSYDPLWLRAISSSFCLISLLLSFSSYKYAYGASRYLTIFAFLIINNCILLGKNGFEPVHLFSAISVFIALTMFCKKRWEFITICVLNLGFTVIAYFNAPQLFISPVKLLILLVAFSFIAYISFLVVKTYNLQFSKAVNGVVELNKTLLANDEILSTNSRKLNALMNSLNDIIFEFDENRICLNTWFSRIEGRVIDPGMCIGKRLDDVLGPQKAKKFNDALDFVIANHQPISFEFDSDFGTGRTFVAKLAPVYDQHHNYTHTISGSITDISEQKKYENALKENEGLLLEAQAVAKTGNWWFDYQTNEMFWSASLFPLLEIDSIPEGVNYRDYYLSLIKPESREAARQYFSSASNYKTEYEHKLTTPKGNVKYFKALMGDMTVDAEGNPKRIFGVLQDITDTKITEKRIKRSQDELLEAQTIAKIGNWQWDALLNKLSWSEEINNIFEMESKAAGNNNFIRTLIKHIHPSDRDTLKFNLKSVADQINISCEYRIVTLKGNVKYVSVIVGKLIKSEGGAIRKIVGTLQDVTDRKQAEIDYQRTENKYKLILEKVKMPAVSLGKNGLVIFCNKYMADLLGYDQQEILGLNWAKKFVPEKSRSRTSELFLNDSFKPQNTNSVICRSGEERIISWQNTVSYNDQGQIEEVTGIGEDITDRQKETEKLISAKEQAEKSSQFKSEFLSIMSHEIRTPMNAVIGTTNLLLSEDPKPDQLEYLNTLKFSGENLLAIINDILDYNKIEAGKLHLNKLSFNIYHLVQKIRQSFYSKAAEKGLEIKLIIDNHIPEYLTGDQIRLGQVLNNLLSNAVKFTHKGKITIKLAKETMNDTHVGIKFTITDTGIGIPADSLEIIFDPFEQESHTSGNGYGGTGLGLAITKRIIELHHGTISVSSTPGKGTQFTFAIEFAIDKKGHEKENQQPVFEIGSTPDLQGMRILVVDDNKMNLMIASKFLKKWQAQVDEALNGHLAIEMVNNYYYDLIIMDLQMPEMDGFEATKIIKRTNPQIPILALTADAMPETHNKAFAAGMCDYLTKPFVPQVLFEKVARYYTPLEAEG